MDLLNRNELRTLAATEGGPHVSVFMPAYRGGIDMRQNPVCFRNLLREARTRLQELEGKDYAEALLALPEARLDDAGFWEHPSDGLAVFAAAGLSRAFWIPVRVPEQVVVGERFHITPLLPRFADPGRFYVLALSRNSVRFLQCVGERYNEVHPMHLPGSMGDALRYEDTEHVMIHVGAAGGRGENSAVVHGQAKRKREEKDWLLRYFREIDKALHPLMSEECAPLVLAGVEYLFPIHREANSYAHLLAEGVAGNPDATDADELDRRAWQIVRPHFEAERDRLASRYHALLGTGRASGQVEDVAAAARVGRVETLFVGDGVARWAAGAGGRVGHPRVHSGGAHWTEVNLVDVAATQTLVNGGQVYAVSASEVPGAGTLAAIYRY